MAKFSGLVPGFGTSSRREIIRDIAEIGENHCESLETQLNFSVNPKKVEDAVVITASGRLTSGEPVLLLRDTIGKFLEDGASKFVLDLSEVSYIDSAALGQLVSIYTAVRNRNGDLKLVFPKR